MDDDAYMGFLYDRGARRLGYASYEEQRTDMDSALRERRAKEEADKRAAMTAWAKAQLSAP